MDLAGSSGADGARSPCPAGTRSKGTEPMTNASTPTSPNATTPAPLAPSGGGGGAPGSRTAILLEWSLAGLAVPPLAILPHELGHYLVLLAMDVPNLAMHYETVSWDSGRFWEDVRRDCSSGGGA